MTLTSLILAAWALGGPLPPIEPPAERPVERPVDFDVDVMPVFSKAGCNSCHGASGGRGGFQLSLFGGDPGADYEAIVRDLEGRRVNLAHPERSLLLAKPTGELHHGGGLRLDPDGEGAARVARWISEGARRVRGRSLERLELTPERPRASAPGATVELRATAHFDDGSEEDVTRWTVFSATDPGALEVDESGRATVLRRGRSVVLARYLSEVVPATITTPFASGARADGSRPSRPGAGLVDTHVEALLGELGLEPAPPVDDAGFLRRARLALTGTLPSRAEVERFLADEREDKRARLVDELLGSEDFVEYWTYRLATLLRIRGVPGEPAIAPAYRAWLRGAVEANTPLDELVRELVTASGDSHAEGPAGFYRMNEGPREDAELVSETFLGARLRCANCHDHPLDRWTQDDYHGLAAVFARVQRDPVVAERDYGEVTHPATGAPAVPRLPGSRFLDPDADTRAALAAWLTGEARLDLARNLANRLWSAVLGRGLVEPVDDLRATNPAVNPALLDALAEDLVASGFDLRHALRVLATSDTFARGPALPGAPVEAARFGASAVERRLDAEVLADAMTAVTGVPDRYEGAAPGTRAIELDPATPSLGLDLLGRCGRESSCEGAPAAPGLAALLHLVNGELVNRKVSARRGRLGELVAAGADDAAIVEDLYLRALGRPPREAERDYWTAELGSAPDSRERLLALEDFLWSLLTCREFETNH